MHEQRQKLSDIQQEETTHLETLGSKEIRSRTEVASERVWRARLDKIDTPVEDLRLPEDSASMRQDEEWFEYVIDGKSERVGMHDYADIFSVPGLYEKIVYERLKCCSPSYVANLLESVANEYCADTGTFRVLDVGAGNGMVGEELQELGIESVLGVDITPEAKEATHRDRPDIYDDYRIVDLTELDEKNEAVIKKFEPNCLTTVAALGFGDIPPEAFISALDFIATPGWLAFNVKESFLDGGEQTGFSQLICRLNNQKFIRTLCHRRYQHRVSVTGEPLFYVAVIAKKVKELDDSILAWCRDAGQN